MYRLFLFSFLILIASTSCSISKRQHLSGYHVDLHPALKKRPSKSHPKPKDKGYSASENIQLKDTKPLIAQPAPFKQASLSKATAPDSYTVEGVLSKEVSEKEQGLREPIVIELKKHPQAEESNPESPPAKAQSHLAFFIVAGILLLLSAGLYAAFTATTAAALPNIFLLTFLTFGLYITLILLAITLLIGLILFMAYVSEEE